MHAVSGGSASEAVAKKLADAPSAEAGRISVFGSKPPIESELPPNDGPAPHTAPEPGFAPRLPAREGEGVALPLAPGLKEEPRLPPFSCSSPLRKKPFSQPRNNVGVSVHDEMAWKAHVMSCSTLASEAFIWSTDACKSTPTHTTTRTFNKQQACAAARIRMWLRTAAAG